MLEVILDNIYLQIFFKTVSLGGYFKITLLKLRVL